MTPDPQAARVAEVSRDLRVVIGQLRRRMREGSTAGDFTLSQSAILLRLEKDGPATVTALANAEGLRPQSVGANVAVLEAAGLVHGAPDPSDGRRTILSLTDRAREEIRVGRATKEDWLFRAISAKLSAAEQKELAGAVELLTRLVEL